jgi:hypothetical protein
MRFRRSDTTLKVIHLVAPAAMKVVMVLLTGTFITRGLARDVDGNEPTILHQRLDIPIHGGDAEPFVMSLGAVQCFFRR